MVREGAESENPNLTPENAQKAIYGEDKSSNPSSSSDTHFGERKTSKTPQTQARDNADYEARKEHSNSGSNTNEGQGMEYVSRKNGSSHDNEDIDMSKGGPGGGRLSKH